MWKWALEVVSKFHDAPMVNESGIVVLLRHVWVYAGKEKAQCEGPFFHHRHYIKMVGVCKIKFQTWCSNFTMIQQLTSSESSFYWDRFECMWEKERVLEKEEGKMDLRGRESVETCRKCKKWPITSLFIARILLAYYLLYFSLFYHFI